MCLPIPPSPEDLAVLSEVVRCVARYHRLAPPDADDFGQVVQLRLLERNYEVFDRFRRRSSLRTYLVVVVTRMLIDWMNSRHGKWRPSPGALRLGPHATKLERLISRDGFTADEAVAAVSCDSAAPSRQTLREIADRLPPRPPRRLVSETAIVNEPAVGFVDPVEDAERVREDRQTAAVLLVAIRTLPPADQRLLWLRYGRHMPVPALAAQLGVDAKALYRRCDRLLRKLRRTLLQAGVKPGTLLTDRS